MYRIWSERALPPAYTPLLEGIAEAVGPANATPETPLIALPGAHAIIASARIRRASPPGVARRTAAVSR